MSRRKRYTETMDYLAATKRFIRSASQRAAVADPEQLAELIALQQVLDDAILTAVAGQRKAGITWQSIANATGTSKPAAVQKWARFCDTPDVRDRL